MKTVEKQDGFAGVVTYLLEGDSGGRFSVRFSVSGGSEVGWWLRLFIHSLS